MWESRHGFPSPARLPGGHRRYSERDVEAVLEVLRLRRGTVAAGGDRARPAPGAAGRALGVRGAATPPARSRRDHAPKRLLMRCPMRSRTSTSPTPVAGLCSAASSAGSSSTAAERAVARACPYRPARGRRRRLPRDRGAPAGGGSGPAADPPPDGARMDADRRRPGRARLPDGLGASRQRHAARPRTTVRGDLVLRA